MFRSLIRFREGIFLMPKVYYLDCGDHEVFKCKGYPGDLTRADFVDLYENKTLDFKVTKWYKDRSQGEIYIKSGLPYKLKEGKST